MDGEQSGTWRSFTIENFPDSLGAVESMVPDRMMEVYGVLHLYWRKVIDNTRWLNIDSIDFFVMYTRDTLKMYSGVLTDIVKMLVTSLASEISGNDNITMDPQEFLPDEDFDLWVSESMRRDVVASILLYGFDWDAVRAAVLNGKWFETGYELSPEQEAMASDDIGYYIDEQWRNRNDLPF